MANTTEDEEDKPDGNIFDNFLPWMLGSNISSLTLTSAPIFRGSSLFEQSIRHDPNMVEDKIEIMDDGELTTLIPLRNVIVAVTPNESDVEQFSSHFDIIQRECLKNGMMRKDYYGILDLTELEATRYRYNRIIPVMRNSSGHRRYFLPDQLMVTLRDNVDRIMALYGLDIAFNVSYNKFTIWIGDSESLMECLHRLYSRSEIQAVNPIAISLEKLTHPSRIPEKIIR